MPLVFKFELLKFEFFEICVNHKFVINFTKKMSIDALIEKIQPKFIVNFYEFQRNSL